MVRRKFWAIFQKPTFMTWKLSMLKFTYLRKLEWKLLVDLMEVGKLTGQILKFYLTLGLSIFSRIWWCFLTTLMAVFLRFHNHILESKFDSKFLINKSFYQISRFNVTWTQIYLCMYVFQSCGVDKIWVKYNAKAIYWKLYSS